MALGVEEKLSSSQLVQLTNRTSFNDASSVSSIAASSIGQAFGNGMVIPVPVGQAIRIVDVHYSISDQNNTGKLNVLAGGIFLSTSGGATLRARPLRGAGVVGSQGMLLYWEQNQELLYYTDYQEFRTIPPTIKITLGADVQNTDAGGAHTVTVEGTAIIETFVLLSAGQLPVGAS